MVQNELRVLLFVVRFSSVGVSLYCTISALITVDTCSKSAPVSLIPNISATIFMNMALIWSSALAETKWLQKVIQHSMKERTKFLHVGMQKLKSTTLWTQSIYIHLDILFCAANLVCLSFLTVLMCSRSTVEVIKLAAEVVSIFNKQRNCNKFY